MSVWALTGVFVIVPFRPPMWLLGIVSSSDSSSSEDDEDDETFMDNAIDLRLRGCPRV